MRIKNPVFDKPSIPMRYDFAAGAKLGMGAHNTLQYNVNNMGGTMAAASEMVATTRMAKSKGISTQDLYASGLYSDDQRNKAK